MSDIKIPENLKPSDPRFGCGPSKIRPAALQVLAGPGAKILGTSHRQKEVKSVVSRVRSGLSSLFDLPQGYEVVLGNGGSRQDAGNGAIAGFGADRGPAQVTAAAPLY